MAREIRRVPTKEEKNEHAKQINCVAPPLQITLRYLNVDSIEHLGRQHAAGRLDHFDVGDAVEWNDLRGRRLIVAGTAARSAVATDVVDEFVFGERKAHVEHALRLVLGGKDAA